MAHLGLNQAEGIPRQTTGDDSNGLELGEGGHRDGDAGRPETTRSDSTFGQGEDRDEPRLDDDPRSERGPSGSAATPPGGAGDEPPG
jgi:hypothetical protein